MARCAVPGQPNRFLAFVRLGRPHFLAGGLALYALGVAIAVTVTHRPVDLYAYAWGQAAITATQLMTHYANDYFDLAADRANASATPWSGGSRVLPDGVLRPRVALVAALALAAAAFGIDLVIAVRVAKSGWPVVALFAALVLSWEYSAPPLRLHSRGLGAPTVALVVTCLTPLVGYLLQGGSALSVLIYGVIPLACAQITMILVIDFPDAAGDRAVGKKTPAVLFGERVAARLCVVTLSLPYLALPFLARAGLSMRAVIAIACTAPLALVLLASLARGDWRAKSRWTRLTWLAVGWFGTLVGAELLSYVSLAASG